MKYLIIFLFLFSCGNQNRNDEYVCKSSKDYPRYIDIKKNKINVRWESVSGSAPITEETNDKIVADLYGAEIYTFYKKTNKLKITFSFGAYIYNCEKLN